MHPTNEMYRSFIQMLGGSFQESGDSEKDCISMAMNIIGLLNTGAVATGEHNGFTPLMLYSIFGVTDKRFIDELQKDQAYVTKIKEQKIANQTFFMDALAFSSMYGTIENLDALYKTTYFDPKRIGYATIVAAANNKPQSIRYFRENNVDLFYIYNSSTPLHIACNLGFDEVVREIMAANPSEQQLSIRNIQRKTAFDLALLRNDTSCMSLMQNSHAARWASLKQIIWQGNVELLRTFIAAKKEFNLMFGDLGERHLSLIGYAATMSLISGIFPNPIFNEVEKYLHTLDTTTQVNAFLLALISGVAHPNHRARLIKQLNNLEPKFHEVTKLTINCYMYPNGHDQFTEELRDHIEKILGLSRVTEIDYLMAQYENNPSVYTYPISSVVTSNLTNISLKKFTVPDQLDISSTKAIKDIIQNIIERNELIAKATLQIKKDEIYNTYAHRINGLIKEYNKHFHPKIISEIVPLKRKVYSLKELSSFMLANSKETSKPLPDNLDPKIDDLIQKAKMLSL